MKHMMNQQQEPSQKPYKEEIFDWRGLAGACVLFPLIYFTGPLTLISYLLQRRASSSLWKAPDRWASIRTFAWLSPLIYIPIWLFRGQIGLFWTDHLPQFLGPFLLWPPTFDNFAARWILALPFAPALAFVLERQRPLTLTMRYMVRRPRPGEVISPYQPVEEPAPQMLPTAPGDQVQKPAATSPRKKASGNSETKAKSSSSSTTTRKKTERDPRPIGTAWAEQEAEEQRRKEAEQRKRNAQSPAPQAERSRTQKAVEPEEELSEEPTIPDPFKAKKFDWRNVKE